MAAQKQDDQHERTFSSYVRIQVVDDDDEIFINLSDKTTQEFF